MVCILKNRTRCNGNVQKIDLKPEPTGQAVDHEKYLSTKQRSTQSINTNFHEQNKT